MSWPQEAERPIISSIELKYSMTPEGTRFSSSSVGPSRKISPAKPIVSTMLVLER